MFSEDLRLCNGEQPGDGRRRALASVRLAWQPPERKLVHGDFLGYRLSFHLRDIDEAKATVIPIEDTGDQNSNSNSLIPNHYPIPLTLGIRQAQRFTSSLLVDFAT